MSVWLYERTLENLRIELDRFERLSFEKQDDFQRATRRGAISEARQYRKEQLLIDEKIRLLTREFILTQRKLQAWRENKER
ncbi:hypothetical protein [Risungbinella massiliensis]|uniref:hypothetical protein n=1 Tax=Risungbinella massiliensis TaxID=1329796 RepID=UPI0005CC24A1|nr:hypothetical protein [Risungbinella massiliensis]